MHISENYVKRKKISCNKPSCCNTKFPQITIKIEENFFICETTKHIVWFFFCAGEIFTTLVDSTVSENKIHSFSELVKKEKKRIRKKATPKSQSAINIRCNAPRSRLSSPVVTQTASSRNNKIMKEMRINS